MPTACINFADMTLSSISILNFKNIVESSLNFSSNLNCFIGDNGMGKTNILDAIYYLSFCKSCNAQGDMAILRHGADFMLVQGKYERRHEQEDVVIGFKPGKKKNVKRNGKEYKKLSEHIGLLPLVMVSPMDWELVRGTGEERRKFMDQIISQGNKEYMDCLIRYGKGIENRNAMIRQGFRDPILFETVETAICKAAAYIYSVRCSWIEEFSPIFMNYYRSISNSAEKVSLKYKSHLNEMTMEELLKRNREKDMVMGYTTGGLHRDDIELMLDSHSMRKIGSQGQCKTYTVAMRLAQYDFLKKTNGITPLLLLDDIFDKLDAKRVESIIRVVSDDTFGQIFITDTNRTHLDNIIRSIGKDYKMFKVENGDCKEIESEKEATDEKK